MRDRLVHWLAALLLLGQLALLLSRIPAAARYDSPYERAVLRLVGPLALGVDGVVRWAAEWRGDLRTRSRLATENAELRERVRRLERERLDLERYRQATERSAAAAAFRPQLAGAPRPADVVYVDHQSWLRSLVLWAGSGAEVAANQPVVAGDGLVGRVVAAAGSYAKVQLVTDRAAAVGAMIARTRRQGVVRGVAAAALELAYIPIQADVAVGDRVVTSGVDGVYPRGILIGTVIGVGAGGGLFWQIEVTPAVDLGRLEMVYLLERPAIPPHLVAEGAP